MNNVIASPHAPKAVGPYSQAIMAGNSIFVSGQLPVNPEDSSVAPDIQGQTRQSLDNLGAILREAGADFKDVVKTTVLLDDIANFKAMNEVYAEYFTSNMPARVCYQVAALPLGVKVEIDAIAVK